MISLPFFHQKESRVYERIIVIVAATILASATRLFLATAVNLYWAIPIWFGMTPEQALASFGGIIPLVIFVAGLNVVQGIVDILVSWALAFKLKLSKHFGTW
jgi:riboflavin transporter FmnP